MLRFVLRRLLHMVLVLWAISVIVFVIFVVMPGGAPEVRMAGKNASPELLAAIRESYGFDEPYPVQYYELMEKTLNGELVSYSDRANVWEQILRGVPATASLVIGAAVLWLLLGVLFGVLSAVYAGRWPDRVVMVVALVGISLPVFWVGLLLLHYLTYRVPLFPAGGYAELSEGPLEWARHLVLPWTALSLLFAGFYVRLLRSNVLDAMNEDYVRTARAKGLSERRVLVRHVLRNALIPVVTLFGLDFAAAFGGGAILTEEVFNLNGVGQYVADSVGRLDLPPILGVSLYGAFFIVLLSTLVDVLYAVLDPRIRLSA